MIAETGWKKDGASTTIIATADAERHPPGAVVDWQCHRGWSSCYSFPRPRAQRSDSRSSDTGTSLGTSAALSAIVFGASGPCCTATSTEAERNNAEAAHRCSDFAAINGKRWYAVCESAVAYLRVSTQRQQRSGLGIEAQRAAIERFAQAEGLTIISQYTEAETGKGADALDRRPQLAAALAAARKSKCSIVVSKLDRLSRDVAFVAGLMAQRAFHGRGTRPGC